jgi:hypothetical protein
MACRREIVSKAARFRHRATAIACASACLSVAACGRSDIDSASPAFVSGDTGVGDAGGVLPRAGEVAPSNPVLDASSPVAPPIGMLSIDATTGPSTVPCPTIVGLSASPAEILPQQTSQLSITYEPPIATVEWLAAPATPCDAGGPIGIFSASSGYDGPLFACSGSYWGPVTVTAMVSLPAGDTCDGSPTTSKAFVIVCENGGGPICPPSQSTCETPYCSSSDFHCYDLQTDPTHCGSCDVVCNQDQVCDAGVCIAAKGSVNLGIIVTTSP